MEINQNGPFIDDPENTYDNQCRLCLRKTTQICQLFRNGGTTLTKLMAIASIQVEEGDGLPHIICIPCSQLLDTFYDFKCQIEDSDQKLRQILKLNSMKADQSCSTNVASESVPMVIPNVDDAQINNVNSQNTEEEDNFCKLESAVAPYTEENGEFCTITLKHSIVYCNKENEVANKDTTKLQENHVDINSIKSDSLNKYSSFQQIENNLTKEENLSLNNGNSNNVEKEAWPLQNICEIKLESHEQRVIGPEPHWVECSRTEGLEEEPRIIDEEEKPLIWRTSRLKCMSCIKSFRTKHALHRHLMAHKRKTKLRFVCYVCEKQFSNVASLKTHIAIRHDSQQKKVFQKNIKEKMMKKRLRKTYEAATQDDEKKKLKFVCKVCSKQFTYQKSFLTHASTHPEYKSITVKHDHCEEKRKLRNTSERKSQEEKEEKATKKDEDDDVEFPMESLQCTQCRKLFATKRNLKRHISTHSGLKYNCTTCGKGFSRVDKLRDHEESKHKLEVFDNSDTEEKDETNTETSEDTAEKSRKEKHNRPHKCTMCPKSFAQARSLANHMERHKRAKETQKRFLCEVCSKCFAQSGSLVAHMRTHTGVRPYVCTVCSRAFTKGTYLQLHMRTHSGEKPYICQYCSKAFARANTLARHITMHTGEAKYHCQICTKSFRRLTSLNEHTYTHTGQRPYACKICSKRYNNAGSLYAHRKKCIAQHLASTITPTDGILQQGNGQMPQVLMYSQKRIVDDTVGVTQTAPGSQFPITNVQSQKSLTASLMEPFSMDDTNGYTINSKPFKAAYYPIYPNM